MNELININEIKTIPSYEVAEMMQVEHSKVLRMIEGDKTHAGIIPTLRKAQMGVSEYFIENTYKVEGNNKTYKCYECTKLGCDMLANKMTGEKGIIFTARYVKKFDDMEQCIKQQVPQLTDEEIMARALLVANKTIDNKNKLLEDAKKEIAEKDRVITQISISQNTKLVRETAKTISKSNSKILIGERRLYERLRSWGWVCKNSTEATQYAVERGYLEVSEGTKKTARGTFTFRTTRVTGKGEIKIIEKLLKEKDLEKLLEENEKSK